MSINQDNYRQELTENDGEWVQLKQVTDQLSAIYKPASPVAVNGSRGGNAALANLLTALATSGFITDLTTP